MKKKNKMHWLSKIALTLASACVIISILNLIFFNNNFLRVTVWSGIFIVMACDFLYMAIAYNKETNKTLLQLYEIDELKYSYVQMGRYVDNFEHSDLFDIELRIENELKDIEVKKQWQAEKLGLKKGDF